MLTLRLKNENPNPSGEQKKKEENHLIFLPLQCPRIITITVRVRWLLLEDGDGRRWTPVGDRFLGPPAITIRSRRLSSSTPPARRRGASGWGEGGRLAISTGNALALPRSHWPVRQLTGPGSWGWGGGRDDALPQQGSIPWGRGAETGEDGSIRRRGEDGDCCGDEDGDIFGLDDDAIPRRVRERRG